MPVHQNKKFVRSEKPPGNLHIQPRDLDILRDLAEYRFSSMEQILALHGGGMRNLQRRLRYMFHMGIVDRPDAQKSFPAERFLIYSLGDEGRKLLSRKDIGRRKEVGSPYLLHAMMISQFHATLTLALRQYHTHPKIERWLQGYGLKDALASRGQSPELVPDAFFTIRDERGALDFFLEADQSTMAQKLMLAKIRTYWKWHREKKFQKELGIENFRVLTIAPSEDRAENLCRTAKQGDDKKTGSNMFLFLSETRYSLKKSEAVLEPIWTSAKGEKRGIMESGTLSGFAG
jgi:hypothetical protein